MELMTMDEKFSPKNLPELTLFVSDLKGKPYMKVDQRLLWFVTDVKRYTIDTKLTPTPNACTAEVTVTIFDDAGQLLRRVTRNKTEEKGHFGDYTEKAETGALGRCLAALGYGTQFAAPDLDEGERIVDAPIDRPTQVEKPATVTNMAAARKPSSFAAKKAAPAPSAPAAAAQKDADEWGV